MCVFLRKSSSRSNIWSIINAACLIKKVGHASSVRWNKIGNRFRRNNEVAKNMIFVKNLHRLAFQTLTSDVITIRILSAFSLSPPLHDSVRVLGGDVSGEYNAVCHTQIQRRPSLSRCPNECRRKAVRAWEVYLCCYVVVLMADWLTDWLTEWVSDWLIGTLSHTVCVLVVSEGEI